jgi:hypothetical protein
LEPQIATVNQLVFPVTTLAFGVLSNVPGGTVVTTELTSVITELQGVVGGILTLVTGLLGGVL